MKRPILHSHLIKEWADKSGKTYRELESLWKRTFDEVEYDRMLDPNKYERLNGGNISQEVQRKFEENLNKGPEQTQEEIEQLTNIPEEENDFGVTAEADLENGPTDVAENSITDELDGLFAPVPDSELGDEMDNEENTETSDEEITEEDTSEISDAELDELFNSGE